MVEQGSRIQLPRNSLRKPSRRSHPLAGFAHRSVFKADASIGRNIAVRSQRIGFVEDLLNHDPFQ